MQPILFLTLIRRRNLTDIQEKILDMHNNNWDNVPTKEAKDAISDFQNYLRDLIENNPTVKINELVIEYQP